MCQSGITIALLSALGKVIESVIARKVTQAAEENGLLPDEQMGNRAHRSTELEGPPRSGRTEAHNPELCTIKDCSENLGPWASESPRGVFKVHPVSAGIRRTVVPYPYYQGRRASKERDHRGSWKGPKQELADSSGSFQVDSYSQPRNGDMGTTIGPAP